jgi:archaellum biogenesis protein FlaJ (TadC family)
MASAACSAAAPAPAAATAAAPAAAAPAPTARVQLAVPEEEPTRLEETDKLYLDFVKELGPNFSLVGEPVVRKLIKLSLVNCGNIKQMASFQPEMLKTLAQAT